jgi:flagellar basal-body rod modification protein FlgD
MNVETQSRISNAESTLRNRATTPSSEGEELKKQDFMNLFLTQMSHQDPLSPMDSGAMMTQLAQLGSMEQLESMNGQLSEMNSTQKEISRFQALSFLDKDVMLEVKDLELANGNGRPVYYSLDSEVDNAKLTIEDLEGSPVFSQDLGLVTAGRHQFTWDGKNDEGIMMGDGKYKVRILATKPDGSNSELPLFQAGRISQVEYRKGQPWVRVSDKIMPLSQVSTVDIQSQKLFGNATPLPIIQDLEPKKIAQTLK